MKEVVNRGATIKPERTQTTLLSPTPNSRERGGSIQFKLGSKDQLDFSAALSKYVKVDIAQPSIIEEESKTCSRNDISYEASDAKEKEAKFKG